MPTSENCFSRSQCFPVPPLQPQKAGGKDRLQTNTAQRLLWEERQEQEAFAHCRGGNQMETGLQRGPITGAQGTLLHRSKWSSRQELLGVPEELTLETSVSPDITVALPRGGGLPGRLFRPTGRHLARQSIWPRLPPTQDQGLSRAPWPSYTKAWKPAVQGVAAPNECIR